MVGKDIRDALIGQPIENAEDILHSFGKPGFVDEKIDDGSDGEDDAYVMMRSFRISTMEGNYYIRLFYGDVTRVIAMVGIVKE